MLEALVRGSFQSLVPVIDNLGKVRRVRASVALRSDMERLLRVLWVAREEQLEERVHVLARDRARVDSGPVIGVGESDVDGLVEEDDVRVGVPAEWVVRDIGTVLADGARSELEEEAGGRGATRSAVEPENERRVSRRRARFEEPARSQIGLLARNAKAYQKKRCLSSATSR